MRSRLGQAVGERLARRPALTAFALMRPHMVIRVDEIVQVLLQDLHRAVDLLSESALVELVQAGLIEAFADAVGLRMLGLITFRFFRCAMIVRRSSG